MIPMIGITTINQKSQVTGRNRSVVNFTYTNAVSKTGGLPLLIPAVTDEAMLDAYADSCDGFILSGGADVSPRCYGENPHPLLGETSLDLDRSHLALIRKIIARKKPFLAICRGHQVLNVACGGTLYQDNSLHGENSMKHMQSALGEDSTHLVTLEKGTRLYDMFGEKIWTNSFHHQSIKVPGEGLKIAAHADDGIVEAVELTGYPFGFGIQWHPESMFEGDDAMRPLFEGLVRAAAGDR